MRFYAFFFFYTFLVHLVVKIFFGLHLWAIIVISMQR